MKLYMFRTFRLSIIRSLFTVHSAMVYVIQVCRQLSSRSICSCSKAVYKPVWHIPLLSVQWLNSWWWAEELSETCRVSCQNKFVKLVHLVGFIIKEIFYDAGSHERKKNENYVWIRWTPPVSRKNFHLPQRARQGKRGTKVDRLQYICWFVVSVWDIHSLTAFCDDTSQSVFL